MKKRGNDRLNQLTPHLYDKSKKELPKWAKIFIPVGSVATASVVVLAVVLSNVLGPKVRLNQIVTPIAKKVTHTINRNMSELTYDSYSAFAHKFVSTMMDANNSKNEDSLGISIPDAYLCLAIVGAISTDEARADILNYLELPDMDALRTATKEVVSTLGTLSTNRRIQS